ncbi:hypothetical protein PPSN_gp78 [Pseudomonas phage SN]|uniref:Uncharacterized protein n=2 Tax=Pbunavirus TaxID=1198980 RepID=J7MBS0_9CAUD|nr:hypothetical protein PPSN_gp78 [Pseudomonas phage SN]YP_007238231.1 hypothetical protein G182_gp76 [Pseudomonas phage KPP12]BAM37074.1 hypothetical protein [Pseudomonas phage KPP12]CAT99743.1 hypothetical protein [Pseudomonas phage SN]
MTNSIKTFGDIQNAEMKELVAFYNAHNADATVKRFSDRKTAERRCLAILNALPAEEEAFQEEEAPAKVYKTRTSKKKEEEKAEEENLKPEEEITEEEALEEIRKMREEAKNAPEKTKEAKDLSAAIANSWKDPEVARKRTERHGVAVTVKGKRGEFKSCNAAFIEFGLPSSKCIRFRMQLKAAGKMTFEHEGVKYNFEIIETGE